ncbi:acyltransferase [Gluconobacter sp. Dm-74]|uniref:acyltransferase family protein n=1 Tax=Gluconobacter sp. Dm-74 TaxID=2799803 RepID=UPI001B8B8C34|nr:acyltransferase [Gluconobacter sp. Dm-74]MBS1091829.1 acyltransferase [Gluconobacter sp. Dm-74]
MSDRTHEPTGLSSSSGDHIPSLQSLRGIASITVLLRHYVRCFPGGETFWLAYQNIFLNSQAAVVVFFVLSGFVLSPSLFRKSISVSGLAGFYVRRFFRIVPLLAVVTALSLIYVKSSFSTWDVPFTNSWFAGLLPHGVPLSASILARCFVGMNSALVPQNWTIACELLVALILPFLVKACTGRFWLAALTFVIAAVLSFIAADGGGKSLPVVYAVDFVVGILTFRILQSHDKRYSDLFFYAAVIGLVGAWKIVEVVTGQVDPAFNDPFRSLVEAIFAAVIIYGLATKSHMSRLLSVRWLVWLGDISFGIYLVHFLVIVIVARLMTSFLLPYSLLVQASVMLVPVLAISLAASYFVFRFIEIPFNDFGKSLQRRVRTALSRG